MPLLAETFDLRLEYEFPISRFGLALIGEAFNVTDDPVYNNFNNVIFTAPNVNPNFGKPTNREAYQDPREYRISFGVRF